MFSQTIGVSADSPPQTIEAFIRLMASGTTLDVEKVVYIAKCESNLSSLAVGDKGISYGIFQINTQAHPDISSKKATSPIWATAWAIDKMQSEGYDAWKTCSQLFDKKTL